MVVARRQFWQRRRRPLALLLRVRQHLSRRLRERRFYRAAGEAIKLDADDGGVGMHVGGAAGTEPFGDTDFFDPTDLFNFDAFKEAAGYPKADGYKVVDKCFYQTLRRCARAPRTRRTRRRLSTAS